MERYWILSFIVSANLHHIGFYEYLENIRVIYAQINSFTSYLNVD